jgi:DNA repair and recombination protein RAD54B
MSKDDYLSGKSFINTATSAPYQVISRPAPFTAPTSTLPASKITLLKRQIPNEPRHDPSAPDAIVLPRIEMPAGVKPIDVVIDPLLAQYLRPHQKEGVKFLYECIMGGKAFNGRGAILADEMGLGKTLTVIALIWTLLSTNPSAAPVHTR